MRDEIDDQTVERIAVVGQQPEVVHHAREVLLALGQRRVDLARVLGGRLDAADGLRELLAKTVERGLGGGDYSALYEVVDPPDAPKPGS